MIKMILPIVDGVVRLLVNVEMSLMNLMVVLVVAMSIVMGIVMMNLFVLPVDLVVMVRVAHLVADVLMFVEADAILITILGGSNTTYTLTHIK
jgi:hypothetical protein